MPFLPPNQQRQSTECMVSKITISKNSTRTKEKHTFLGTSRRMLQPNYSL